MHHYICSVQWIKTSHRLYSFKRSEVWTGESIIIHWPNCKCYVYHRNFSIQMGDCTLVVREEGHTEFLGVMVCMWLHYVTGTSKICNRDIGHYQQDANTYAEWGVDCKISNQYYYVCMQSWLPPLQMLKWIGAIQNSMVQNWILTSNILKWYIHWNDRLIIILTYMVI